MQEDTRAIAAQLKRPINDLSYTAAKDKREWANSLGEGVRRTMQSLVKHGRPTLFWWTFRNTPCDICPNELPVVHRFLKGSLILADLLPGEESPCTFLIRCIQNVFVLLARPRRSRGSSRPSICLLASKIPWRQYKSLSPGRTYVVNDVRWYNEKKVRHELSACNSHSLDHLDQIWRTYEQPVHERANAKLKHVCQQMCSTHFDPEIDYCLFTNQANLKGPRPGWFGAKPEPSVSMIGRKCKQRSSRGRPGCRKSIKASRE